ncbi:hypothetical protein HYS72_01515 [Candidatus Pacearchaeota archaeon]|nr:hypothetical protein [Candidatus Pacearchaeota archaeon]
MSYNTFYEIVNNEKIKTESIEEIVFKNSDGQRYTVNFYGKDRNVAMETLKIGIKNLSTGSKVNVPYERRKIILDGLKTNQSIKGFL